MTVLYAGLDLSLSASGFDARVRDLVDGTPQIELCISALLDGRAAMMAQLSVLHRELLRATANDSCAGAS